MTKNVSISGINLNPDSQAYPCGETSWYYPEGTLLMKNKLTQTQVTIISSDLSLTQYGFKNKDTGSQWANVESGRYWVWSEKQVGLPMSKYWGFT